MIVDRDEASGRSFHQHWHTDCVRTIARELVGMPVDEELWEAAGWDARRRDDMFRSYVQEAATSGPSEADQLAKLASLSDADMERVASILCEAGTPV